MHELWCGKPCCDCETSCEIDEEIPCSPDCDALNEDGSRDIARCIDSGCDAYELGVTTMYMMTRDNKSTI